MSAGLRLEDFQIVKEIGKGGFGVVYEAIHPQFNKVALKKINCGVGGVPLHRIKSEYELLNNVSHNNIVKFYGQFKSKNDVYLVLELCPFGSMRSYVRKNGPLSETAAAYVLKQLLCAVQQLHAKRIMHRDLSAGNILISKMSSDGLLPTIKICDFGLARSMRTGGPPRTIVGTPGFMAPELLGGDSYDEAADVFSLGAALYTMLTAEDPPVKGKPPLNNLCRLGAELINSMMACDSERIALREVFVSDFMKTYLPDGRGTLNSFYGSREHSVDRARTSYERRAILRRSGSEDRRYSREPERYSRGRREPSYDRRVSDRDRLSAGIEREGGRRRAASQPPFREKRIVKERSEESGFQSGEQMISKPTRRTATTSQPNLSRLQNRKDNPWPLKTDRLNGKVFIRPKIGRLRVTDVGDLVFEQESNSGNVALIMLINFVSHQGQEITTYLPVSSSKAFPKQDDPRVELMRTSRRGPFSTLSSLTDNDLKVYNSVRHMLGQLKSQVDKVVLRRPAQFVMSAAKLMENGDFRIVPIVDDILGEKLVRKTTNGRIVYRRYTGSDGGADITDTRILQKMSEVYDLLIDIESIVEKSGQKFPFLMSAGGSSNFPVDSVRITSSQAYTTAPYSTQSSVKQSFASAPSVMESRVLRDLPRMQPNVDPFYVKDIGRGCVSVRHILDGRFIRMSTGVPNVLIFRENENDAKSEIRFDVRDLNIPKEARDLVDKVKQVIKDRRRKAC